MCPLIFFCKLRKNNPFRFHFWNLSRFILSKKIGTIIELVFAYYEKKKGIQNENIVKNFNNQNEYLYKMMGVYNKNLIDFL